MTSTDVATVPMRAGERRQLIALTKLKIKALRAQIEQTHADRLAEIDARVAERFRDNEAMMRRLYDELAEVTKDANAALAEVLESYSSIVNPSRSGDFSRPYVTPREDGKAELRRALMAAVHAQTAAARQRVTQLEAELIEQLIINSLQSDAARDFVSQMPTIDTLMPLQRLAEVEARMGGR